LAREEFLRALTDAEASAGLQAGSRTFYALSPLP